MSELIYDPGMKVFFAILILFLGLLRVSGYTQQGRDQAFDSKRFEEYKAKAEKGDAEAQTNLGLCYFTGQDLKTDLKEAVKWFTKAAEQGFIVAQNNLASCYARGLGVEKNPEEALKWYRKGAEQGDAEAQRNVGVCYHNGEGVTKDAVEAVKWYRKAAEQGNDVAQLNLGICYSLGDGVGLDKVEAYAWWSLAAKKQRPEMHVDEALADLQKKMSKKQITSGIKRVTELSKQIEAGMKAGK